MMSIIYILARVATLLLLKKLVDYLTGKSSLDRPPGPAKAPIIGNLHQAPDSYSWLTFYEWSKKYGPIMHLNMVGQSVIILSTTQAAQDLLNARGAQYSDRPRLVVAGELVTKGMHLLLRPYDAQYRLHKRMEAPLLNARAASFYQPLQELESRQLLHDLMAGYDSAGETGIDCDHWFERTTASFIYALIYGYRLKTGHEKELTSAKHVQEEASKRIQVGAYIVDSFPFLNILPGPLAPWKAESELLYQLEHDLHVGNLKRGLAASGWNFCKHMRESNEAQQMSFEELAFDAGIIADAALDTTTISLDWFAVAWISSGAGGWVPKAQELIDKIVGRNRLPEFSDRRNLVYIDAIVQELLRWKPVVVGGVPHFTRKADTYMGYYIPANSVVVANHWAITRDEAVFGPNAMDFVPERWLDGVVSSDGQQGLKELPATGFGFGRRVCTGQQIARNTLFIVIARLLWAFDVQPGISETRPGERQIVDPSATTEKFTPKPLPFKSVYKPRDAAARNIIKVNCHTHDQNLAKILDHVAEGRKFNS